MRNFRGIVECDVGLTPLTFFIGSNGSGKTSFVDALLFLGSSVRASIKKAIEVRGGINSVLHLPVKLPSSIQFELTVSSDQGVACRFQLSIHVDEQQAVSVEHEECRISNCGVEEHWYVVENGAVTGSSAVFPPVSRDRVFLSNAAGLPPFRPLYEFLQGISSVEPTPTRVHTGLAALRQMIRSASRESQQSDLATKVRDLAQNNPDRLEIIHDYLRAIATPFDRFEIGESDGVWRLYFLERASVGDPVRLQLSQMSDGLVNAAEIFVEMFELPGAADLPSSPLIVEEPDAFLHPGAVHTMRDSFLEASQFRQVLVTTHSSDLLDADDISSDWIRTVYRDNLGTHIQKLDPGTESIIRDHLYSPGQLLRQGGLIVVP